jgi:hypothetical protein
MASATAKTRFFTPKQLCRWAEGTCTTQVEGEEEVDGAEEIEVGVGG